MNTIKFYFVRHAPVVGKKGIIYGDDAEIDLKTQTGTINALAKKLPNPDETDWYCSGVDRARKSAQAVFLRMGFSYQRAIQERVDFKEQDFGDLIGQGHEEITDNLRFIDGKIYAPAPPGGEALEVFVKRVASGVQEVRQEAIINKKNSIVIFCHGGTIRAAHIAIQRLDLKDFITLDTPPLFCYECIVANSDVGDITALS